jgi:hypothetical protein
MDYNQMRDMVVFPASLGSRVVAILTSRGLLLVQVSEVGFEMIDKLLVSRESGLLSGGDIVAWARGSNVESVRKGKLLMGSRDAKGKYYETLLDLSSRSILGTWDELNLLNTRPSSGEIVYDTNTYSGILASPVLGKPLVGATGRSLTLGWDQDRPDLVDYYVLQVNQDGGTWSQLARINAGTVRVFSFDSYQPNSTYQFRVQSGNLEGPSGWSNVQTITRSGDVCKLGSPTGGGLNLSATTPLYHDFRTTTPSQRAALPLSSFSTGGGSTWSTTLDQTVPGGKVLSFNGSGEDHVVSGQISLTDYSLVVVNSLMSTNAAAFTLTMGGASVRVVTDGSGQWEDSVLNKDYLLPPGIYSFEVRFYAADAPVGVSGYLSAIQVVLPVQGDLINGRAYTDPSGGVLVTTGQWSPAPMYPPPSLLPAQIDTNFPDCVDTITPDAVVTEDQNAALYFATNFPSSSTIRLHGSMLGSNGTFNVKFSSGGTPTVYPAVGYRAPVDLAIPSGPQVVCVTMNPYSEPK